VEAKHSQIHRTSLEKDLTSADQELRTNSFKDWAGAHNPTLAFVFTDIVDSTTLVNELGDEEFSLLLEVLLGFVWVNTHIWVWMAKSFDLAAASQYLPAKVA
jgi:hypothetical protein